MSTARACTSRRHLTMMVLLLVVGAAVRVAWIGRPLDHRIVNAWRQSDYYQIARNFRHESGNILYPRIDWRGDTPGYAEMELPVVPWFAAQLYRVFGERTQVFRALTALFSVVNLGLFVLLSRRLLRPPGATAALAVFIANPVLIIVAGAMQPETLMHTLLLATALLVWSWCKEPRGHVLLAAGLTVGLAILVKLPAAHMGLLMAYVVIRRLGIGRALRDPVVYVSAAVALIPPVAWYRWAHGFWVTYGNSLGVSNESHWIGPDLLWPPTFLVMILVWETVVAFTPTGWLLAATAWRDRDRAVEFSTAWFVSAVAFYVLAARTSSDTWAFYYHILSVAPAALLIGAGFDRFEGGTALPTRWRVSRTWQRRIGWTFVVAAVTVLGAGTAVLIHKRDTPTRTEQSLYECSRRFSESVPRTAKIVVRGGRMFDVYGRPVAYNESMVFAWMDRKGFNYGAEEFSLETIEAIARRGGRYWMVARSDLDDSGLRQEVTRRYDVVSTCEDTFWLVDLGARDHDRTAVP